VIRGLIFAATVGFFALVALAQPVAPGPIPAAPAASISDDTVLIRNSRAAVTKADYDGELLRIPADIRAGYNTSPTRVSNLVNNLALTKTLAAEARAKGLDKTQDAQRRIASEVERILSAALLAEFEAEAGREFDARTAMEPAARERYLVYKDSFRVPEKVTVTHILFEVPKHSAEEAQKLAQAARARIAGGADMNALAREISEDLSAKRNDGRIEWFAVAEMDPEFSKTAFALKKVGDVSEPVQSRFGYHVIRLDGRKPPGISSFDEVKAGIIADMRRQYVEERRAERVAALRNDPTTEINNAAIETLLLRADPELIRKAHEGTPAKP